MLRALTEIKLLNKLPGCFLIKSADSTPNGSKAEEEQYWPLLWDTHCTRVNWELAVRVLGLVSERLTVRPGSEGLFLSIITLGIPKAIYS